MSGHIDVVVIGGGYAGVMAANRLTRRADVAVTLVNPRASFVERVRLHQVAGGSHSAVVDYREILAERVRLVVDTAELIDAAGQSVRLASGATLDYDYLIYGVGSGSAAPSVPGVAEFAYPVAVLEEARRLRSALDTAGAAAAVTVVGGGSTGIEVAAELAEQGRAVTLICGGVLGPYLHPRVRRSVADRLAGLGVSVLEGGEATVVEVTRDSVRLGGGRIVPSGVTIWTAGFGVPDLASRSGLRTDAVGRLLTDETLTSVDDERIVAAGDAAAPSDRPLRMSCQTARPLGAHAADTVLARIAGERPTEISVGYFGQCIALGRRAATLQLAAKDDTATRFAIGGRLAAFIKERACRGVIEELVEEAAEPGTFRWKFTDDKRRELVRAEGGASIHH
ncbi:NAD(P)/FAD-dependent oxidoreductase [Nocardia farcinica]|uniref:NAD(P)/FAD-dependent oxidoreductase n=1 Tax=Nocardia farcinica TaxID=37329 RepID=UPI0015F08C8E|nr:FAD-dependent oxidoreductase [Nocardia farcinica]MBA4858485.1 FAD-dependent oxidoreductase [Nocardia farcinica]MBC9819166.1 FAD-dependent oxidoreductase [Nocardia farcinica]